MHRPRPDDRRPAGRGVLRRSAAAPRTPSMRRPARCCGRRRSRIFRLARVTGSPVFHNGRLYVPVASGEETAGAAPTTSAAGSAAAWSRSTPPPANRSGRRTRSPKSPMPTKKNTARHAALGTVGRVHLEQPGHRRPAQRAVRRPPATTTATRRPARATRSWRMDLDVGKIRWSRQMTAADAWTRRLPPAGQDELRRGEWPRLRLRLAARFW